MVKGIRFLRLHAYEQGYGEYDQVGQAKSFAQVPVCVAYPRVLLAR